jgi:hypothetical protein
MKVFSDHPFYLHGCWERRRTPVLPWHKSVLCKTERELPIMFQGKENLEAVGNKDPGKAGVF